MLTSSPLVGAALFIVVPALLLTIVARVVSTRVIALPSWCGTCLSSRWMPVFAGVVTAMLTWFVWGSLNEPGVVHDEQGYLLQARIFAGGRWTGESPPLSAFFEQMHVFVEPRLAAKYPPGHALVLAPGIWFGLPGLMPVVLNGLAGALVFAGVRRIASPTVALLTWALWSTSPTAVSVGSSYFSQTSSTVLWLFALWALLGWREDRREFRLVMVSASMALMVLVRPATAIGLVVSMAVLVLRDVWRNNLWRQLTVSLVIAIPILSVNLLWHERTLGDVMRSPYREYSRTYMPFDKPGFGVDSSRPLRALPPELATVAAQYEQLHATHQPAALPRIFIERLVALLGTLGQQWRLFLVVLFIMGAVRARGPIRFTVLSGLLLMLMYLTYAHSPAWTLYSAEVFPVFFLIASVELVRFVRVAAKLTPSQLQAATVLTLGLMTPFLVSDIAKARVLNDGQSAFHRAAVRTLASIDEPRSVVFVHYPPAHNHNLALVENNPDYREARTWTVYDRGVDNEHLLALTDRSAYRLRTDTWTLERLR